MSFLAAAMLSAPLTVGCGLFELASAPALLQPNMSHAPCTLLAPQPPNTRLLFGLNMKLAHANMSKQPCRKGDATDPPPPTQAVERYGQDPSLSSQPCPSPI